MFRRHRRGRIDAGFEQGKFLIVPNHRLAIVCVALVYASGTELRAQELQAQAGLLRSGARVRLTLPALRPQRRTGVLDRLERDSIFFWPAGERSLTSYSMSSVHRIDVSAGTYQRSRTQALAWGAVGVVGGALLGRAVARASFENSTGCGTWDFFGCNEEGYAVAVFGLVSGAFGGALAFRLSRQPRERWQPIR